MSARVRFEGLEELRAALRALPGELRDEAKAIVLANANDAAETIRTKYPRRTGNLRDHVVVTTIAASSNFGAAVVIKNTAKHAFLFENGTQTRKTNLGANRGAMPPGRVFVPTVIRQRRQMHQELVEMVRTHGLEVHDDGR